MPEAPTPRRPKDPRIQEMIGNGRMWETIMQLGGGLGYAGDDPNPRRLPRTTLSDYRRNVEAGLQAAHQSGTRHIDNALYFAFYADRFRGESDRSIAVPRDDLWWLLSPGDTVLLSDKVTHHYTSIFDVDHENERVSFLDAWPDRFFLKEGLNAAGVAAKVVGNTPISITRDEFRRVAVGLVTLDTSALLEDYFAQHPERAASVEINLSCGLSLLDVEKDRFARLAAPYLRRALRLAQERGAADTAALATGKLFVALTLAVYQADSSAQPLASRPFADELRHLTERTSRDALLATLDVEGLCRLGSAAGRAGQLDAALEFLDRAVAADSGHEQARWLRAIAREHKNDPDGAAADAAEAVRLNIESVRATEAEREALDPRDRFGRGAATARIASRVRRRGEEYVLSFRGQFARERWDEAREAAQALIELLPEDAEGYKRLAALEHRLGRHEEARALVRQAVEREKDPDARAALEKVLVEVSQ